MGGLTGTDRPFRIFFLAGEPSGDLHASRVARELIRRADCELLGLAGPRMVAEGVRPIVPIDEVAVVGVSEVLTKLPAIWRARGKLLDALADPPDLVLPVDYPGFNLRFAREARKRNIPVLYYVGPQVWAWGRGRLAKMRQAVDHVAVVFPFEVPLYRSYDIPVTYVGHPLAEEIHVDLDGRALRERAGLGPDARYLALLPGSRTQEIEGLLPPMLDAFDRLRSRFPELVGLIAAASPEMAARARALGAMERQGVHLLEGHTHAVLAHARAAIVASGTATLETAALGTPLVIVYRVSPLTYWLARVLVRIPRVGLPNIVAGEEVAPERIQGDATGPRIAEAIAPLIEDGELRRHRLDQLRRVRESLGEPGAAARVAELALDAARAGRAGGPAPDEPVLTGRLATR